MTQLEFVSRFEADLARRGLVFERAALLTWVEATWQHIQEDPGAERWADEFLDARAARVCSMRTQTNERPTTSAREQSSIAGMVDKKHDHMTRFMIVVVAVVVLVLMWLIRRS
jgi:hypothetical protein